jgi:hypothetical protein
LWKAVALKGLTWVLMRDIFFSLLRVDSLVSIATDE